MSRTNNNQAQGDDSSPSYQRRQALRQADVGNTIRVLDSYPLDKYFDISQRLLDAFQKAVDGRRLDEAYVYGLRFAAFGLESLPKHKEYRLQTTRYNKQKRRNAIQVEKVISMMEIIKQRMDAEECVLQERRRAQEEEEAERQRELELEEQKTIKEQQRKLELQKKKEDDMKSKNVEQSAMTKLLAMQSKISAPKQQSSDEHHFSASKKPANIESSETPPSERQTTDNTATQSGEHGEKSLKEIHVNVDKEGAGTFATTATPSKSSGKIQRKMTPISSKEQKTIDLLDSTIRLQEKRLVDIEMTQIPALVRLAKEYLRQDETNRDAALKCVARKRALERQLDVIKAAIFNMETQMFMLENAMEDRQVHKALEEASHAMKSLQQSLGDSEAMSFDLTDLTATLPPSMLVDQEEDDEELLEELQGWISPEQAKDRATKEDDQVSILSMPNVPDSAGGFSSTSSETADTDSTVEKLIRAVLG